MRDLNTMTCSQASSHINWCLLRLRGSIKSVCEIIDQFVPDRDKQDELKYDLSVMETQLDNAIEEARKDAGRRANERKRRTQSVYTTALTSTPRARDTLNKSR